MTPLILHIPHASVAIPDTQGYLVGRETLEKEMLKLTDWYTDDLFSRADEVVIQADFSRIFCDVERFADDRQEVMGSVPLSCPFSPSILKSGYVVFICANMQARSRKRAAPFYGLQTRAGGLPFRGRGGREGKFAPSFCKKTITKQKSHPHSAPDAESLSYDIQSMRYFLRKSRESRATRVLYTKQATAKAPLKYRTRIYGIKTDRTRQSKAKR